MSGRAALTATVLPAIALVVACLAASGLGAAVAGQPAPNVPTVIAGIPPEYLAAYRSAATRFQLGSDGWSYLAGIGKVESDHGRSSAPGVHSGQNANGCCAGPMQIHNGFGTGAGTWGAYAVDGDDDGRKDIYAPADAVATAAHYLRANGAPANWRTALLAYNHAGWYVDEVLRQAAEYRGTTIMAPSLGDGRWLAPLPSFPGESCDERIVGEVEQLARAYGLRVTDCFGGLPHAAGGEHPLGLAVDWVPKDGNWQRTERLARDAGWRPACAAVGCPGGHFRVVLYNGYPGHGDPAHSGTPHLHVSWAHAPAPAFTPAAWVRLVLTAP
jgi:hypothetical protein